MQAVRQQRRGFTLIELLIVVIVIAILAAIAIPVFASQRDKAKEAAVKHGAHAIQVAVVTYATDHGGEYPAGDYVTYTPNDELADNLGNRYLDTWPRNPWTGEPMANTGGAVLFNTDFGSIAETPLTGGKWAVVDGMLVPPLAGGSVAFGDTSWTDVQLDVSATLSGGSGYGVYFRSDGKSKISGYCFQFDPGLGNKFAVRKVVEGKESAPVAIAKMPADFKVYDATHVITIDAVGSHIVCKVDGVTVLDFKDETFKSGGAGLRAWGKSTVGFLSATALSGHGAGGGEPNQGDFAYSHEDGESSYGLVGWLADDSAFVIQPNQ